MKIQYNFTEAELIVVCTALNRYSHVYANSVKEVTSLEVKLEMGLISSMASNIAVKLCEHLHNGAME